MSRTRIELPSGKSLGLSEDIAYSLNFAIADIRNPESRNANYSKTIQIPASKIADVFFKYAFEIDGIGNYNPNVKARAIIYIDDCSQIDGFLQLLNIINEGGKIIYEINIKGNVTNIFQEWGDRMLSELDLSSFDHTYNKTNQVASWTAPIGVGYVYPMIDYGQTNGVTYAVENFFPAIYLKQYLDSCLALAGYTYESNFINDTFFKRLIVPYNSTTLKLGATELVNRYFKAKRSTSYVTTSGVLVQLDTDVSDVGNQFDTGTYTFTANNTGTYNFKHDLKCFATFSGITGSVSWGGFRCYVDIKKMVGGIYTPISSFYNDIPAQTVSNATTTSDCSIIGQSGSTFLNAGESVVMVFTRVQLGSAFTAGTAISNIKADSYLEGSAVNSGIFDGNNLEMNYAIPQNIKIKDFVKWVINRFNLYVQPDKTITNKLYIEPRNDFYANGQVRNWTKKLALDKPIEIRPMGDLDAIEYRFQDKEDKDYFNTKYKNSYDEVYGTYRKIIENDFLKNIKVIETGFSPTPLTQIGNTDRIISQIINVDSTGSVADVKACNIRLLYYSGVKTTTNAWTYTGFISGTTTELTYPYAGHVDEPLAPTLDLSFGVPQEVYYVTSLYTNNNCYNRFWRKYIEEISDSDSKLVTAYLNLTTFDISILDFRDEFYIDKYKLRLNKIFDYNFVANQLTKCEFIKIKEAQPFIPDSSTIIGGVGVAFDNGDLSPSVLGTGTTPILFGNVVARGNSVSTTARSCIVTGDGNYVGDGCENIIMEGCVRCSVASGTSNITIRNCTDLTVLDSNIKYESNQIITEDATIVSLEIDLTDTEILALNTTPKLLVDAQGTGKVIELISAWRALSYGGTPYLVALDLEIYNDTATASQFELINGLNATATNTLKFSHSVAGTPATNKQFVGNKGLYLRTRTTDPTTGNSTMKVFITYRIVTT